ncbi:MAG: lysophospholipid acyltransferase family protein [Deltaproteobacteria bacterium]|nr:lysophospholipid acyltransferase family protein [Deltaproteobacteria bacterium]
MDFKDNGTLSIWIYRALYGVVWLISLIPFRVGQSLGRTLGNILAVALKRRIKASLNNLRYVFGDIMSGAELIELNGRIVAHFAQMLFEVPHILRLNRTNLNRYVIFENEDALSQAIKKGRGVFMLTGHFGNWELMSAAMALRFNVKGAVVVRPADFAPVDRLLTSLRSRFGTEIIAKKRAMKKLLAAKKENKVIGILLDQNVDWYEGVFVPFLGKSACTNKGLALVALRTGSPVIPAFSVRQPDGRYRVMFEDEVSLLKTGDKIKDIEENTALFTQIIGKYVSQYPDQWFWFHKRWKTRPFCPLPEDYYHRTDAEG